MKKLIQDQSGIALVTSLLLTLISLTIVLSLMYLITSGIQASAANKRYKTVLQAGYGATELVTKDVLKAVFEGHTTATRLKGKFIALDKNLLVNPCVNQKFNKNTDSWNSDCQPTTYSANQFPDLSFVLQSATSEPYRIYAKIVDTYVGNTDTANNANLTDALNVTETNIDSGETKTSNYRIEIQAERNNNPQERANLSVLYAY